MTAPPPPTPFADPGLLRAEWQRFGVACLMVATMVVETLLAFTVGFYSLPLWLAFLLAQALALHVMNGVVARARQRAFDQWRTDFDNWVAQRR